MSKISNTRFGKVISVALGFATAMTLSVGVFAPQSASALTTEETITQLLAQIAQLQAQITALGSSSGGTTSTTAKCTFTKSLTIGSQGSDVTCLQDYLKSTGHYKFSGGSTGYFGPVTRTAVAAWQSANGVSPAVGYFGSVSQAKYNSVVVTTTTGGTTTGGTTTGGTTTTPTGTGLTVSSPTQPAATLAPNSGARIPFTKVTLTAGSEDVTVTGVNVERTGLAADASFSGLILLDENGLQIGVEKTLNSNHQATLGDTFVVKAGTSKTLTIAGNMAADNSTRAGDVASLSVNGINTSATVSGTLPIVGASHTINNSLSIGTIPLPVRGSNDPGAGNSKEVGTTGYTFSSIKVTAGSAEKVRLHSIKWNQSGSASASDLANVKTYIDGVAYDTVVSSDGKYYTSTFGSGKVLDKGGTAEISIKGDIASGSGRTIDFDVYRRTDLYATGETYGYGITPTNGSSDPTDDTGAFSSTNPWYDAYQATVSSGSLTVTKSSATIGAAQNIAENVSEQILGAFDVEAKGEAVSVASLVFRFSSWAGTGATASTQDLTSIALYDANGNIVAGPADIAATSPTLTLSDTVTFPVGKNTYVLKGKPGTDYANNDTIAASTTPSSDWTTVTGQTTGNTITPSSTTITGNTMTLKTGALAISVSSQPVAQTVVSGVTGFTFAKYQLDATNSGENVRLNSIPLEYNTGGGTATNISNCMLYDGSTALNTGSNVISPSAAGSSTSFTFDSGLIIPKGTVKTVELKCDIVAAATGVYSWGYDSSSDPAPTGVTSSQAITETETDSAGQAMTLSSGGALTVSADTSTPGYTIAAAGSTVTLGVLKFHAANEAINLKKVALQITNTASSSRSDLVNGEVTLWDGSTQVGTAVFTSNNATSTLTSDFIIPKDGDKVLTLKGVLTSIGSSLAGVQGHLLAVNYDGADSTGTQGTGVDSSTTINHGSTSDTSFSGVRIFKAYPTFAKISVPSTTLVTSTMDLYRFSVKANNGPIGIYKFTVNIATSSTPSGTSSTTVTNLKIKAYTDSSLSSEVSGFTTSGQLNTTIAGLTSSGNTDVVVNGDSGSNSYLQIPSGSTYYFKVIGDVTMTGGPTSASIVTNVQGDAAFPALAASTFVDIAATIDGDTHDDFIWSANATTTSSITHQDWSNGYFVPGLASDNMDSQTLSK